MQYRGHELDAIHYIIIWKLFQIIIWMPNSYLMVLYKN